MKMRTTTIALLGLCLSTQVACETMNAALDQAIKGPQAVAGEKVAEAIAKKDIPVIEQACTKRRYKETRLEHADSKKACEALSAEVEARVAKMECEKLPQGWAAIKGAVGFNTKNAALAVVGRAAECKDWSLLFGELALSRSSRLDGSKVFPMIAEKGHDVESAYLTHAADNKVDGRVLDRFANWRAKDKKPVDCDQYLGLADKQDPYYMLRVLRSSQDCNAQSVTLALKMLTSPAPYKRTYACGTLGKLGGPNELKKVQTLAIYDKDYKVSNQCHDAVGRIKLRK